jgi:murein DD-endopeptidase MepM/ murein hydrolase activator NlpD
MTQATSSPTEPPPETLTGAVPTTMSSPTTTDNTSTVVHTAVPDETPEATATPSTTPTPAEDRAALTALPVAFSYPIGLPGRTPGDSFYLRHGYQVENTWFNPNHWHTGEDWYAVDNGETAEAEVYAVADGVVTYTGGNYPGRVVIVRHADELYSMYGHLDPNLAVQEGQELERGSLIGTVLRRTDDVPNHLHFEIRTFQTNAEVNGNAPRYGFRCGVNCPPGPGYWPIGAPDLPSDLGWRNPTHIIAQRAFAPDAALPLGEIIVASRLGSPNVTLWSAPPREGEAPQALGNMTLTPGDRYALVEIYAGLEDTRETSAQGYTLWYRIVLPDERSGWVQAAVPSTFETGADGRPATISFNFFPIVN